MLEGVSPSPKFSHPSLPTGIASRLESGYSSRSVLSGLLLGVNAGDVCSGSWTPYLDAGTNSSDDYGANSTKHLVNYYRT